jgi:Na+/melibiose symporter-like transporter
MRRAGSAVGAFLLGLALKIIQYDQDATVLAPITFWGLRVVMYGIPLISALVQAVLWTGYDLEAKMPEIKTELARRAGKAAPAEEAPAEEAPAEL